jgi:hypothetical protein
MLAHDVYQLSFDTTTRDLEAWTATQRDIADIDIERSANFWRLRVSPHAVNACPVELILHRHQRADLMIGPETFENRAIGDFSIYRKLLEAIAAGRITIHRWESVVTGAATAVETIVRLDETANAPAWTDRREVTAAQQAIKTVQHFVPYRR